ncbi:hypothetical protein BGZ80_001724 [Entomortierella chlamydospora]|uniref:F-box domain-containing protein n=1 Tax=Entomortierella chlamydospora TaxID=101097 RepID=A0A9P6N6C2_9FUNG|nr:hypothetical protein BGZ79_004455 [Entomortierella chlamydospora]KAG0024532.1 hypothetical protein BGZ80_001724 [Entomortierella chlamydospora]
MDNLPVETFQVICSFCSLHVLANLRLVSKTFRDRVDGSLTARRSHATPRSAILPKGEHDQNACYIRVTLSRQHEPITVIYNRYNIRHNYLEFSQNSAPSVVDGLGIVPTRVPESATQNPYHDFSLGKLDLNLWEEQEKEAIASGSHPSPPPSTTETTEMDPSVNPGRRGRRSSITQASIIRRTEHQIGQEIASGGPITPLSQTRPVRNALASSFGTASPSGTLASSLPRDHAAQGDNYMVRFARMMLGSTGSGPQSAQTRPGMTAAELAEQARQLIHTVDPEVLSSKKQYKFILSPGVHFVGDNGFIMRYTISLDPTARLLFKVDYIRVSWRWVASGVPVVLEPRLKGGLYIADPMTRKDPFPSQRIGGIYAERYNLLLREIHNQEIDHRARGELALVGYDENVLPRDFISVNLLSQPVLAWITRIDNKRTWTKPPKERKETSDGDLSESQDASSSSQDGLQRDETESSDSSDSDWEDLTSPGGLKGPSTGDAEDQEALQELLRSIKYNAGYLTARNIVEEMLAEKGYSRDLIWKYGIVRREMMGPVPGVAHAKQLLQKILASEAAESNK